MYNLQPGMGLGFSASKQMAFGLGTAFLAIVIIAAAKSKYHLVGEDFDLQAALKEDKELMEILTIIIQTGLFD